MKNLRGQNTLEYIFIIGIVAAGLAAMLVYFGRAFQGNVRDKAEQLGAGQYDPGKITVDNKTTKTVMTVPGSNNTSTNTTTIQYADMEFANTLQDQLSAQLAAIKKIETDLVSIRSNYEKAIQSEAEKNASKTLGTKLKERVAPYFSGDAYGAQVDDLLKRAENLKAQLDNATANKNKLQAQLDIVNENLEKAPDNIELKHQATSIQNQMDQIDANRPMVELMYNQAVLGYMEKKLPSSPADSTCQTKYDQLVKSYTAPPCESADPLDCYTPYYSEPYYGKETKACSPPGSCGPPYESPEQAKNDIQAQLDNIQAEAEAKAAATPTPDNPLVGTDYSEAGITAQVNREATIFDAIDNIRPPFKLESVASLPLSAVEYQTQLLNKETEYFQNISQYLKLQQDLKNLYATTKIANKTLYVGSENNEKLQTIVHKTKSEKLDKF